MRITEKLLRDNGATEEQVARAIVRMPELLKGPYQVTWWGLEYALGNDGAYQWRAHEHSRLDAMDRAERSAAHEVAVLQENGVWDFRRLLVNSLHTLFWPDAEEEERPEEEEEEAVPETPEETGRRELYSSLLAAICQWEERRIAAITKEERAGVEALSVAHTQRVVRAFIALL